MAQKREGCISLTFGEPDFNTPDDIKGALKRALDSNLTHYAPNAGYDSLRKAIADYEHQKGVFYKSNEVIVTIGATEALFDALFAVIEPGDEVIVPVPAFSLYESIITMCDGKTVRLDTRESGFQIEEEQLRTAYSTRTKAVIPQFTQQPDRHSLYGGDPYLSP